VIGPTVVGLVFALLVTAVATYQLLEQSEEIENRDG
jgi:hypothetical protein